MANDAYAQEMAAYNNSSPSPSSDDDTSANGVGGGPVMMNLQGGKGYNPMGNADAATKVNAAAAIADYGVSAGGCFVQH